MLRERGFQCGSIGGCLGGLGTVGTPVYGFHVGKAWRLNGGHVGNFDVQLEDRKCLDVCSGWFRQYFVPLAVAVVTLEGGMPCLGGHMLFSGTPGKLCWNGPGLG